jgi:hypothetical protein
VRQPTAAEACPHGDPTCPCQDRGDPCHYDGTAALACPTMPERPGDLFHCHVEGCESGERTRAQRGGHPCGLSDLGADHPLYHDGDPDAARAFILRMATSGESVLDTLRGTPYWRCGLLRYVAADLDHDAVSS